MTTDNKHPVLECELCPKACKLAYLERGDCRVRYNAGNGKLKTLVYGKACSLHVDPMEKKPMFHFLPGSPIFSLATAGCNLHCLYCQNWEISQADPESIRSVDAPPDKIVAAARHNNCMAIAYTYTDPIIFYEYTYDTAKLAQQQGLRNILVTAGYINQKPLKELLPFIDGANIDLKVFDDRLYREITTGTLKPVLDCIKTMVKAGKMVELTNLVVPTVNDDEGLIKNLCQWIMDELGPDIPLHFSRFWPKNRMKHLPPTPAETLQRAAALARDTGLHHVYVGNLATGQWEHTRCPGCGEAVIKRQGYRILEYNLDGDTCRACGHRIHGVWWPAGTVPPPLRDTESR